MPTKTSESFRKYVLPAIIGAIATIAVAIVTTWGTIKVNAKQIQESYDTATAAKRQVTTRFSGGTVTANGAVRTRFGDDFTIVPDSKGGFRVGFKRKWSMDAPPVVMATVADQDHNGLARAKIIDENTLLIKTLNPSWKSLEVPFSFIVIDQGETK